MCAQAGDPVFLLEWARDLGKSQPFFDFHIHPFDVLSEDTRYKPSEQTEGLFSRGMFPYHTPAIANWLDEAVGTAPAQAENQRAFILSARLTYNHTGPKVFADQMDLAGLSRALTLPVARTAGKAQEMLEVSRAMFQADERFLPGCAFPVGMPPEEIAGFFRGARQDYGVRAIKLHPNLAAINLASTGGHDLIEAGLRAAGELQLPMVVHAGRTPCIEPVESREFGTMARLALVNWGLSKAPVILAHAGGYSLTLEEAREALPLTLKLLERHPNLMADLSNLESHVMALVLQKIPAERLVFGSDALYLPIWKAWLRFLNVLRSGSCRPEDDLVRIASLNPARCLAQQIISVN